jgi:chemotaxis protein CheY-P-specific phosphatase CheC
VVDNERNLPDWIDGYMLLTDNSEPPLLFKKWTAISTIASALQRKCRFELGMSLTIYPNFYIVLVGPSATGKGTAMDFAQDIIEEVSNIKVAAQATSLQALIRRMKDINLTDIDLETNKQIFHSSLTIFSKEFTVFLGYHNSELMAALCDWFDCGSRWTYDTIKRDREEIIGVWVNLLAGTTPDNLQSSLPNEAIGGGLTSRIIFVNEEKRGKLVIFPSVTQEQVNLQQMLINDLSQISLMSGNFGTTQGAMNFYADWCVKEMANPPFQDKKFDGYNGRRRRHLNALSMICTASHTCEMIIKEDDIQRAASILEEVEVKMGTIFKGIGKSDISSVMNDAITYFALTNISEMPLWEFARRYEGDLDKFGLDRLVNTMQAMQYITLCMKPGVGQMIQINKDRFGIKQTNKQ